MCRESANHLESERCVAQPSFQSFIFRPCSRLPRKRLCPAPKREGRIAKFPVPVNGTDVEKATLPGNRSLLDRSFTGDLRLRDRLRDDGPESAGEVA
jgi:hypothetical protein